jgi:Zn-finger nucleic acid-binding protein
MSATEPGVSQHKCPVCAAPMKVIKRVSLQIDVCDEHGVWLDKGELEALIRRGRLGDKARRNIAEAARHEGQLSGWFLGPLSFLFD